MYKWLIIILTFSLISCTKKNSDVGSLSPENQEWKVDSLVWKEFVKRRCIKDKFVQGQDDNVYGLECIEGEQLLIQTSKEGSLASTSHVADSAKGFKIKDVDFKNKSYITQSYTLLKGQASDKDIPFLSSFLPKDEEFRGSLGTKYRIIFKLMGNRLALFKASKNWEDLPDIERTSLKIFREDKSGKMEMRDYHAKSYKRQKGDYYAVPFIGYPITYCKPEAKIVNDVEYLENRLDCEDSHLLSGNYIKIKKTPKRYDYKLELKKDLFPAEYFEGLWYFSEGRIEAANPDGEVYYKDESIRFRNMYLIALRKEGNRFNLIDMSGDVEEITRNSLPNHLPVKRHRFEMAQDGNGHWEKFGEREREHDDKIKRPFAQIDFESLTITDKDNFRGEEVKGELIKVIVEPDYLSYVHKITYKGSAFKWKTSYARAQGADKDCLKDNRFDENCLKAKITAREGFNSRRWFKGDHEKVFGIMPTVPQTGVQQGERTETELLGHVRMIRFNTRLNTEEEKRTKTKTIKWYFSKNSTKDPDYREVAEKAVRIYDQAFEHLSQGRDKRIKVELVKTEEKDLGDLRYNILNLVKARDIGVIGGGLLGVAPSYANPDTGQIIGATANILIHNQERNFDDVVRNYIRYEIFQKDKRTPAENEIHVLSPYLRGQIEEKCPEVGDFVNRIKAPELKLRTELNDREVIISCGKKLTQQAILELILHEMGHNFGLAHNFKASVDGENYYKTEDEIRTVFPKVDIRGLAHSSSVMDYGDYNQLTMDYLGKYDLAALRYLYFDEMEQTDGSIVKLKIEVDPEKQSALTEDTLQNRKKYLHCSDRLARTEMMCDRFDHGFNPKSIVQENILRIKRILNHFRYRYDLQENLFTVAMFSSNSSASLHSSFLSLINYYKEWNRVRDDYFKTKGKSFVYILKDKKFAEDYIAAIEEGLETKGDYALYYPVRQEVSNFLMELIEDSDEMRCHFTDSLGQEHKFSLELIREHVSHRHGDNLYVEDCWSSQILDFFAENSLTLYGQTGYENFFSYYPIKSNRAKKDVRPLFQINSRMMNLALYQLMMAEFDKLQEFSLKTQQRLLNLEKNQTDFDRKKNTGLHNLSISQSNKMLIASEHMDIMRQHVYNMNAKRYKTGKGFGSFDEEVIKNIENLEGKELKTALLKLEIPFLATAHEEYVKFKNNRPTEYYDLSFQDYLFNQRKDTVNDRARQFLTIPLKKDSFAAQMLTKYNETLRRIKELEKKDDLSALEKLYKTALKQHFKLLKSIYGWGNIKRASLLPL